MKTDWIEVKRSVKDSVLISSRDSVSGSIRSFGCSDGVEIWWSVKDSVSEVLWSGLTTFTSS